MKPQIDKNLAKFADLMIEKIESFSGKWQKPWFAVANKPNFLPQNISGRSYSGGNSCLLLFLCEKEEFKTPVFLTFKQAKEEGLTVRKGSVSFPIYYAIYSAYHKTTKKRISLDQYNLLPEHEKKEYQIFSSVRYFWVFNLDQTNFSEVHPQRWESMKKRFETQLPMTNNDAGLYQNYVLDTTLSLKKWVCPIVLRESNKAYYSPACDKIIMPQKTQFVNGEAFYATLLHEMAHSTGVKGRLNRKNFYRSDNNSYGHEELIAELSAALSCLTLGISCGIREENVAYLQAWCKTIKEDPKYILTVLGDAVRSSKYIAEVVNVPFVFGSQKSEEQTEQAA